MRFLYVLWALLAAVAIWKLETEPANVPVQTVAVPDRPAISAPVPHDGLEIAIPGVDGGPVTVVRCADPALDFATRRACELLERGFTLRWRGGPNGLDVEVHAAPTADGGR